MATDQLSSKLNVIALALMKLVDAKNEEEDGLDMDEVRSRLQEAGNAISSLSSPASDPLFDPDCSLSRLSRNNLIEALTWTCRKAGGAGCHDTLLAASDLILRCVQISSPEDANRKALDDCKSCALGYKGYALAKLKRYQDALPILEESRILSISSKTRQEQHATKQNKRRQREVAVVEETIILCCNRLNVEPPLPPLIKFPRTVHLANTGGTAVSDDDIVLSSSDSVLQSICDGETVVTIEEKIDGANLGLSLSYTGNEILVQNRSHYVSSGDHAQFGPISAWIEVHRDALKTILGTSQNKEGRTSSRGLILYGEWLVARHSIPYQRLPGYFIAFDLYDLGAKRFFSRTAFHEVMRGSDIPVVPVITSRTFGPYPKGSSSRTPAPMEAALRTLLESRSHFRTDGGPVEGIVLRIDDMGRDADSSTIRQPRWLADRYKLVRPDFVAGCSDGHWASRKLEKQRIDYDFEEEYLATCYTMAQTISE